MAIFQTVDRFQELVEAAKVYQPLMDEKHLWGTLLQAPASFVLGHHRPSIADVYKG